METRIFETTAPAVFRDYMKVLNTVVEDVNLVFDHDGVSVMALDPSHIAMVDFHLPDTDFDRYYVDQPFTVCLRLETVLKALNKISKKDRSLIFEYDQDKDQVTLELRSDIQRRKTLDVLEPIEQKIPNPKIFMKSTTRILLDVVKRIIDDFKDHEHLTLESNDRGITFSINSDDLKETTPILRENDNILDHGVEEDTRSVYSMSYLTDFIREAKKISEVVNIQFSTDLPMKIDVELPRGHLIYWVAPCIGV